MKELVIALCSVFIFFGCSDLNTIRPTDCPCNFEVLYDKKEHAKDSLTNWFWVLQNFDTSKTTCWDELAELYFNMAPDTLTSLQHSYFILVGKEEKQISNLQQLLNSDSLKKKVIGLHKYGRGIKSFEFQPYPFGH
jgi:hypothetical protein